MMSDHRRSCPIEVHSLDDEGIEEIKVEDFMQLLVALQAIPATSTSSEENTRIEEAVISAPIQVQQQRAKKTDSDALRNVQDAPRTVGQTNDKTVRRKKEQLLTVFSEFVNLTTLVSKPNDNNNWDGSCPRHEAVLLIMNQVRDPPTCGGRNTTDELLRREKVELIAMGSGDSAGSLKRIVHHLNRAHDTKTQDQYDLHVLLHNAENDIRKSTKEYLSNITQKRRRGKRDKSIDTVTSCPMAGTSESNRSSRSTLDDQGSAPVSPSSHENVYHDMRKSTLSASSPRKRKSF